MAFNAAASGWAKRRAPLHPRPAEMGLDGPWALGFSEFGLGLGVSGLILQGFGLRI